MSTEPLPEDTSLTATEVHQHGLTKATVALPPDGPLAGYHERDYLKALAKLVSDRLKFLDGYMVEQIPPGSTVEGITHSTWDRKSTRWKEAYATVYRDLLTTEKRATADTIVKDMTATGHYPRFTAEDDDV